MTSTIASARRRLIRRFAAGLFLLGVLCLAACPAQQPAERTPGAAAPPTEARGAKLVVWADPVLVKALEGLGGAYRQASGGGSYLVEPVERAALRAWAESGESAGRPAPDVLLFGGKEDYLLLLSKQRIAESTARTFAGDRLLVLKPLKTTYYAPTVFDLAKSRFAELAVGDPDATLVGLLTEQALTSDGAMPRLKDRVKTYPDSVQLAQVLQGRDDALVVVFSSQAGGAAAAEPLLLIDSGLHEPLQYKAVASAAKETDPAVVAFLRWLAEDTQTQQALGGYGLLDRDTALGNRAAVIAGGMPQPEDQPITAPKEAPAPGQPAPQAPETKSPPAGN